jgi:hypothetical protein
MADEHQRQGARGKTPPHAPRRLPRFLPKLALASIVGLGVAGAFFEPYRRTWLRPQPPVPRCAMSAQLALRELEPISGYEPHDTTTGQTVGLTRSEDMAVRCASGISGAFSREITDVFAETDPERRATAARDLFLKRPPGADHDADAAVAYLYARSTIAALPKTPSLGAAADAIEGGYACRFWTRASCARRPLPPVVAMVLGPPSALGLLATLGALAWAGVLRVRDAVRARRRRRSGSVKAPVNAPETATTRDTEEGSAPSA